MLYLLLAGLLAVAYAGPHLQNPYSLTDVFLQNVLQRYEPKDYPASDYMDVMERVLRQPGLQYDDMPGPPGVPGGYGMVDYDYKQAAPSLRDQEFLQHSSLWGNQYVTGGAGEGSQHLRPEGSIKNTQVTKTDGVLPAYCEPPNPCPLGYTASDGCLETFENTAAFSRKYQARQECMCDTEHMFNCPDSTSDSEISALARSITNKGLEESALNSIMMDPEKTKVVAKKFHVSKKANPYLDGERLPVAAKKGGGSPRG
ncbi:neuroendocrine protein 7B2-like isoform X2 [Pollicipes pollicipes]|uniref:neuroendocrine protein 7B2-like isoform X2 n=1 Tax=Pollicipes pollicipes TaxID=41117 RepID=UPI001884D052|nr:neuroendocrine protein 7B2-like isoform X2 [Pollicipes pollicipes]XP_037072717.1 neuroendocrine protein 7B2-like isoform X2 [Pollicipes pollicipes]